ncbi:MAG: hypothetical protein LBC17_04685 [Lactobacillaceae bacterium]|jgi:hypothetical protein|nr:hypothetical protein [Lactobacillaceae bacterium]
MVTKLREERVVFILIGFIFIIMLAYNFSIQKVNFGDDSAFLQQFTHRYHSNYFEFLKFRYNNWTSRLVIETFLVYSVKHLFIWKILNAIAMSAVAIVPTFLFKTSNKIKGIIVGLGMSLLIPENVINGAGWVATTVNYTWVMAAALISILPVMNYLKKKGGAKYNWKYFALSYPFLIYATNQEQMVVILFFFFIVSIGIAYLNKKNIFLLLPHLAITIASLIFALTAKGNAIRNIKETQRWLPAFSDYSILHKMQLGYTSTLKNLFLDWSPLMLMFILLIFSVWLNQNKSLIKKIISGIPLLAYIVCMRFAPIINQKVHISSGQTYWSLIVILTLLIFIYLIGIFGASNNFQDFILVTFILSLAVGSHLMMGFSPTIWASGPRTFYFTDILIMIAGVYLVSRSHETKY